MLRPVVMSGPSGCGKSTLWGKLREEFPNSFGFSVSHTTRKPRVGEEDGKDYHFTTMNAMEQDIKQGKFIEYAKFSGNMYGTSKESVETVLKNNRICLLDIDEQGVKNIKQTDLDALYIFIAPPSIEELRSRLTKRGTEKVEEIEKRMATAQSAIQFSETDGVYDIIIVNEDLNNAYKELKAFLLQHFPILAFPNIAEETKPIVEAAVTSVDEGVEADIETEKPAEVDEKVAEIATEAAPETQQTEEVPSTSNAPVEVPSPSNAPVEVPQVPSTSNAPVEVLEAPATQGVPAEVAEAPVTQEVEAEVAEAPVTQEVEAEVAETPATQEVEAEVAETPATQEVEAEVAEAPATQEVEAEVAETPATPEVSAASDEPAEASPTQEVQTPATQEAESTETPVARPDQAPPAEEPEIKEAAGDHPAVEEIEIATNDTARLIAETSSNLPQAKSEEINLEELSLSPAKIQLSRDEDEDAAVMTIDEEAGGDNSAIISERKSHNKHRQQDESEHLVDTTQSSVVDLEEEIKRESSAVCGAADAWCTIS